MTETAARALKQEQEFTTENSYELIIYDSCRPQKSVDHFVKCSKDQNDLQIKKHRYYPRINKED